MIELKDPKIIAALRMLETSAIVTLLGVLGTLQAALASPGGLAAYDWHGAAYSLAIGLMSGAVNALVAYINAVGKQIAVADGTTPVQPEALASKGP